MTSGSLTTEGSAASLARPGVLSLARLLLMPMAASALSRGWTPSPGDAPAENSLGQGKAAIYDPSDEEEPLLTLSGPPSGAQALFVLRVQSDGSLAPVAFRFGPGQLVGTPHLDTVAASIAVLRHDDVNFDHVARSKLITPCA